MEDIISYLERLVLIKFSEDERRRLEKEIPKILDFFRALDEVKELESYEPLFYVHDVSGPMREDEPSTSDLIPIEELERNAVIEGRYFKAPRTVAE